MEDRAPSDLHEISEDDEVSSQTNTSLSKKEQKRRPKPKDGKELFCGVCGDRAMGYNFDAVSCESCKAFFRRNALKVKPFVCSFEGNCLLDAHSRKFCSGCRLQKCFVIGMKKEWILGVDQLQKRRQRQQQRRLQTPPTSHTNVFGSPTSTYGNPLFRDGAIQISSPMGSTINTCHSSSDYFEGGMPKLVTVNDSASHPHSQTQSSLGYTLPPPSQSHTPPVVSLNSSSEHHSPTSTTNTPFDYMSSSDLSSPSMHSQYDSKEEPVDYVSYSMEDGASAAAMARDNVSGSELMDFSTLKREIRCDFYEDEELRVKPLNPYIRKNLESLCQKYKDVFDQPYTAEDISKLTNNPKTLDQMYNMTDMFIRRLIRFTKCIPEFKSLSQDDQIHLLKGGIMELFVLRSCVSFNSKASAFKFRAEVKTDSGETVLQEGGLKNSVMNTMGSSMFKTHMKLITDLQALTGQDYTVLILIFVIQLMNPSRPNVKNYTTVAEAEERHLTWLNAYLRSKNDGPQTRTVYTKIIEKMREVQSMGKASCQLLINVDIEKLEPLLVEIFDL